MATSRCPFHCNAAALLNPAIAPARLFFSLIPTGSPYTHERAHSRASLGFLARLQFTHSLTHPAAMPVLHLSPPLNTYTHTYIYTHIPSQAVCSLFPILGEPSRCSNGHCRLFIHCFIHSFTAYGLCTLSGRRRRLGLGSTVSNLRRHYWPDMVVDVHLKKKKHTSLSRCLSLFQCFCLFCLPFFFLSFFLSFFLLFCCCFWPGGSRKAESGRGF